MYNLINFRAMFCWINSLYLLCLTNVFAMLDQCYCYARPVFLLCLTNVFAMLDQCFCYAWPMFLLCLTSVFALELNRIQTISFKLKCFTTCDNVFRNLSKHIIYLPFKYVPKKPFCYWKCKKTKTITLQNYVFKLHHLLILASALT